MEITDLTQEYYHSYFCCLEEWSDDIKEAGNHKEEWFNKMKDKGLRVKIAIDDGKACGMIQYVPAEYANFDVKDIYFIYCIWVHGHKQGIGNYQKKGIGKRLLQAAEDDVKMLGKKGIAAWGISLPFWMKASWYKKHGYKKVDKDGMAVLLWKPFTDDAVAPNWIKEKKRPGKNKNENKVTVTSFYNGWCPVQNMVYERAKRASIEFEDRVIFNEINTFDKNNFKEWGISDALFIDGKKINTGPPPSFQKIYKKIKSRVNKLQNIS
ncbi:MAG: GNAT family N-acetyltransferase [Prolixibacteraceae bacterium]|nr:GNAT family N-acetyltransferase [Prolixibacteraceae bacterium]